MKSIVLAICVLFGLAIGLAKPTLAISKVQEDAIVGHCDAIHEDLKNLQHADSRIRVYLGRDYETILSKYIVPLNMRLVENNLLTNQLIDNRTNYEKTRLNFTIDYVEYQKGLEDLVVADCKKDAKGFYDKLVKVRQKRDIVSKDVVKMRKLMTEHVGLVRDVEESL